MLAPPDKMDYHWLRVRRTSTAECKIPREYTPDYEYGHKSPLTRIGSHCRRYLDFMHGHFGKRLY